MINKLAQLRVRKSVISEVFQESRPPSQAIERSHGSRSWKSKRIRAVSSGIWVDAKSRWSKWRWCNQFLIKQFVNYSNIGPTSSGIYQRCQFVADSLQGERTITPSNFWMLGVIECIWRAFS